MKKSLKFFGISISWILCALFLFFSFSGSYAASAPASKKATATDKIVAFVNDDVITQSELDQKIATYKQELAHANMPMPAPEALREKVLNTIIDNTLQLQLAKKNHIEISDADLNSAIENIVKGNKITLEQLKQSLAQGGTNFEEFRKQLREQMLISRLQHQALSQEISVSEEEVNAVLKNPPKVPSMKQEFHIIDFLIPIADSALPAQIQEAKNAANSLVSKLQTNADVKKMQSVKKFNNYELQSNDLGWRNIELLPTVFASEVAKAKVGDAVGPIQAPNGMHVLKIMEQHGGAEKMKLTKEQAQEFVYSQKINERAKTWIKELRSIAYVKVVP